MNERLLSGTGSLSIAAFAEVPFVMFCLLAALLVVSALGTVLSRNTLHSALWLTCNLMGVSVAFGLLDAPFLAVVQILVYAGAIVVLFLFVMMLLNLKDEAKIPPLMMVGGFSLAGLFVAINAYCVSFQFADWDEPEAMVEGTVKNLGRTLFTDYGFSFEVVSLVLIAALVASVLIAKKSATVSNVKR